MCAGRCLTVRIKKMQPLKEIFVAKSPKTASYVGGTEGSAAGTTFGDVWGDKLVETKVKMFVSIFHLLQSRVVILNMCLPLPSGGIIMHVPQLVLLLGLLLCSGAHLSNGQHWSHGWYPGGKRDLDSFSPSEVRMGVCVFAVWYVESCSAYLIDSDWNLCILSQISEEIKLCEAGECSYLRPQRRNVLRNILVRDLNLIYSSALIGQMGHQMFVMEHELIIIITLALHSWMP